MAQITQLVNIIYLKNSLSIRPLSPINRSVNFASSCTSAGRPRRLSAPAAARGQFQDHGNKTSSLYALSVFWSNHWRIASMRAPLGNQPAKTTSRLGAAFLLICFGGSLMLSANTSTQLRTPSITTCYCHCAESRAHKSCVKMCDSPKFRSKNLAARCAKPRFQPPAENKDAGPRFPRPGRAERAQLSAPASNNEKN